MPHSCVASVLSYEVTCVIMSLYLPIASNELNAIIAAIGPMILNVRFGILLAMSVP